jgi:hypothetical protein
MNTLENTLPALAEGIKLPSGDPIVAELHAIRDALSAQFNGDLAAYAKAVDARWARPNADLGAPLSR